MPLLSEAGQRQVAETIARIERETDAELVTVLAPRADDYRYIALLWAALVALVVPALAAYGLHWWGLARDWSGAQGSWASPDWPMADLLLAQWLLFILLSFVFRIPAVTMRLVPRRVRFWRASNLAKAQFLAQNLHHTQGETGMLIFVAEAERYVEILVDRGIARHFPNETWQAIIDRFTARVHAGETLQGFLECIESCGELLKQRIPATHDRNELPNHLVILDR